MSRRRNKRNAKLPSPRDVLARRITPSAEQLIALIRSVNPTDRDLAASDVHRRYTMKSRLQAVLVKHYADQLEVLADPETDGLILIRHRPSGQTACHAIIDQLDQTTRSWVRRKLDQRAAGAVGGARQGDDCEQDPAELASNALSSSGALAVSPRVENDNRAELDESSTEELIQIGHRALGHYEYERAAVCYWRAFRQSRGALSAALALLEFLVDHLAAYHDALDVAERLSTGAQSHELVRAFLGLAAARAGKIGRAIGFVRGLEGPRVVETHVILARQALRRGDGESASRHLADARRLGPSTYEIIELDQEINTFEARQRAPLEAEVVLAHDRGSIAEAEEKARRVLATWPNSRIARRVLNQIEERRRLNRVPELLARAHDAITSGEFSAAVAFFEKAVENGADRESVAQRIAMTERQACDYADQQRAVDVSELVSSDDEAGFVAYVALDDRLRTRVRKKCDSPLLFWLEEIGVPLTAGRGRAAVDAVFALARARHALARGDGHKARAMLCGHEKQLSRVRDAQSALAEAERLIRRSERERVTRTVGEARDALHAGELDQVRDLLQQLNRRTLSGDDRRQASELSVELARRVARRQLVDRVSRYLDNGNLLDARRVLATLIARCQLDEREHWRQKLDDITAQLRRTWCVRKLAFERAVDDLRDLDVSRSADGAVRSWITVDGGSLVLATSRYRVVFIRVVAIDTMKVKECVILRAPSPIRSPAVVVDSKSLWLIGEEGNLLRLSLGAWDILCWRDISEFIEENATLEQVIPIAGTPFIWVLSYQRDRSCAPVVIDLERWCVHRKLSDSIFAFTPMSGFDRPLVLCYKLRGHGVYHARGAFEMEARIPSDCSVRTGAIDPRGSGMVFLHGMPGAEDDGPLMLSVFWPDGGVTEPLLLELYAQARPHSIATGLDIAMTFIVAMTDHGDCDLVALKPCSEGLEIAYRVSVPRETFLVTDAGSRKVAALVAGDRGPRIVPLGAQKPVMPLCSESELSLPSFRAPFLCGRRFKKHSARCLALTASLSDLTLSKVNSRLARCKRDRRDDPAALLDFIDALRLSCHFSLSGDLIRWAWQQHPEHPEVVLEYAEQRADKEDWHTVLTLLESVDRSALRDDLVEHFCHLLGIALTLAKRKEESIQVWLEGMQTEGGGCQLDDYISLAWPLPESPVSAGYRPHNHLVQQFAAALREADRWLAEGDGDRALEVMDRPMMWRLTEVQSAARLAEAYLQSSADGEVNQFRKAQALAALCDLHDHGEDSWRWKEVPVPLATWDRDRIGEVVDRARDWLDWFVGKAPAGEQISEADI